MQPIYIKMEQNLGDFFGKYASLEFLNNLENCLLIMADSCKEIYNDKKFVKLATAGHHNVIYIKHNLYQQSNWSRTIDFNTSHINLFKSASDIQQFKLLGKQLNLVKLLLSIGNERNV